jgi:hypothetical protein
MLNALRFMAITKDVQKRNAMAQAVSLSLSPLRPGFAAGTVHVEFVVDKASLRQLFLRVLRVFPVSIIPLGLSIFTYHLGDEQ